MKNIIFILVFILFNNCASKKTTRTEYNILGNLAYTEMKSLMYEMKIDTNLVKSVKIYSYSFNKKGETIDSILLANELMHQKAISHTTYKIIYDSLGRYSQRYATRIDTQEKYLNDEKIYNQYSNIIESTLYTNKGKLHSKMFYYYDTLNRLETIEKYSGYHIFEKPKLDKKIAYKYKNNSLKRKTEHHLVTDEIDNKIVIDYNEKHQETSYRSELLKNSKVISYWETESIYDNEKLINLMYFNSDNETYIKRYKYNDFKLVEEITRSDLQTKLPFDLFRFYYEIEKNN